MILSDRNHLCVRATLSALDTMLMSDKEAEHYIKANLRRALADEIEKLAPVIQTNDLESDEIRYDLDLYVFSPKEFHAIVRAEANRILQQRERARQYPPY